MAEKTFVDENGYLRFKDSKKLVHRWIAYNQIYKKNRKTYFLPFSRYQIHHKDKNPLNNNANNLDLYIKDEHKNVHIQNIRERKFLGAFAFWGIISLGILVTIILFFIFD